MKTGKGAGAPSRRTRRTGEKTAAKKKRGTAARMPRSPKTEAERLRDAAAALAYLKDAPMHLVFTGPVGAGKTSIASGTAVLLARLGKRVLLVSMDPDMNLAELFNEPIGSSVTPIQSVPGLSALELNPRKTADLYRKKVLRPMKGFLSETTFAAITEQLFGTDTEEIACFDRFTALRTDPGIEGPFDHVILDTAPSAHTIRYLGIPAAWNQFFERRPDGQASIALTAGLGQSRALYDETLRTLKDPQSTRLILTATLSRGQIRETARLAEEYSDAGLRNLPLVLNAEMEKASGEEGTLDAAVFRRQRQVLRSLPKALSALPRTVLPLQSRRAAGADALQGIFRWGTRPPEPKPTAWYPSTKTLATLVRELHDAGPGLILLVGKRSVGKTTLAAAIALRLAALGGDVHLVTTDPAALKASGIRDTVPGLEVTAVDPRKETGRYRVLMLRTAGRTMKEDEKALLEEDLRGPWAEETAVFYAVSRYFREAETRFLVMDTAPEGHTLLLIDAADTYHRAAANRLGIERTFRTPLEFLQEPALTRAIFVTRAEPSALRETKFLKDDLRRAGIAPWAYIVNGSLAAAGPMSPILKTWAAAEEPLFTRVAANTRRYAVVPLESEKPIGAEQLLKLTEAEEPDKPEG